MCAEELLDWLGGRDFRATGCDGSEQFEEFLTVASGEAVCRMSDDVGMDVICKIKADCEAARVGVRSAVGNLGDAGGVGKARGDRGGWARCVRSFGERLRGWRGLEGSDKHEAFRVGGAEAGVRSEDFVELIQDVVGESDYAFVVRQRHWGSLRSGRLDEGWAVVEKINGLNESPRENHASAAEVPTVGGWR